jgi:hypothetical protein
MMDSDDAIEQGIHFLQYGVSPRRPATMVGICPLRIVARARLQEIKSPLILQPDTTVLSYGLISVHNLLATRAGPQTFSS